MLSLPPVGELQDFPAYLHPVVEENRLHLSDNRPFDLEMAVAPVLRVLRMTRPLRRDADPTGERKRTYLAGTA